MKKEFRVRKHSEFDLIIKTGTAFRGHYFSLHCLKSDEAKTRIGIAVGKRNGGAVTRVKIKRQVRAMISMLWEDLSVPLNLIIVVRAGYTPDHYDDGLKELEQAFGKVKANIGK